MRIVAVIFLIFKFNILMSQDTSVIQDDGIYSIRINALASSVKGLCPIEDYINDKEYFFPSDSQIVYFLPRTVIDSVASDSDLIDDVFVVTNLQSEIKLISIFYNKTSNSIYEALVKKFGICRFFSSSSISNIPTGKRYMWDSKSNNEFSLDTRPLLDGGLSSTNLTIHSPDIEFPGEWIVSKLY